MWLLRINVWLFCMNVYDMNLTKKSKDDASPLNLCHWDEPHRNAQPTVIQIAVIYIYLHCIILSYNEFLIVKIRFISLHGGIRWEVWNNGCICCGINPFRLMQKSLDHPARDVKRKSLLVFKFTRLSSAFFSPSRNIFTSWSGFVVVSENMYVTSFSFLPALTKNSETRPHPCLDCRLFLWGKKEARKSHLRFVQHSEAAQCL